MLYSIIPPILVVLSIIGIIIFLMKKANRVAQVADREAQEQAMNIQSGVSGLESGKNNLAKWGLALLEGVMRMTRAGIKKLEKMFVSGIEAIRRKRNGRISSREVYLEKEKEANDILDKIKNYQSDPDDLPKKKEEKVSARERFFEEEEKVVKPMISDRVVSPRSRQKKEERLEDILIERIAANPRDIEAYERLGELYMEAGNLDHAKECFKQIMKLDNQNMGVRMKMRKLERMLRK